MTPDDVIHAAFHDELEKLSAGRGPLANLLRSRAAKATQAAAKGPALPKLPKAGTSTVRMTKPKAKPSFKPKAIGRPLMRNNPAFD